MSNQKVELEMVKGNADFKEEDKFRVLKLVNRLEPAVGSLINKREVKSLIDSRRLNVVIVPQKS